MTEARKVPPAEFGPVSIWASFEVLGVAVYRRALAAAILTFSGIWMVEAALYWTVIAGTGSGTAVGLVVTFLILPSLALVLPVGVITDRVGPKTVMVVGLCGYTLAAVCGAGATRQGAIALPVALVIALLLGGFNVVWELPANVLLGRVVEEHLMSGAIGLGILQFGFGRIVGGLLSGIVLQTSGPPAAMLVGGAFLVIATLLTLTLPDPRGIGETFTRVAFRDFRQGLAWLSHQPTGLALIALAFWIGLFGFSYLALVPVIARHLNAGPTALGILIGAGGVGMILAAVMTDLAGRRLGRGRLIVFVVVGAGLAIAGLGMSTTLGAAAVVVGLIAGFLMTWESTSILVLQKIAPVHMRGRVLSVYWFVFWGILPVGTALAGLSSDLWGSRSVLVSMGTLTVASGIVIVAFYRRLTRLDIDRQGKVVMP
jgi:MFS family permease